MSLVSHRATFLSWISLIGMTAGAYVLTDSSPSWVRMWGLSLALYFVFKWAVYKEWANSHTLTTWRDEFQFFILWPGMEIAAFFGAKGKVEAAKPSEWLAAVMKTTWGAILVWLVSPHLNHDYFHAWAGMIGLILMLHFGSFHLLSLLWRAFGVNAEPIMKAPLLSRSLSEFWSERWNRAFNKLANHYFFKTSFRTIGFRTGILFTFLMSGLIHELVISVPARGGYGLPTLYFLIQGLGILIERSRWAKRSMIFSGKKGLLFTWTILAFPVPLLFHTPFLNNVILPFLNVIHL